jgi:fructose/tagatose bisphosphate aldolase
MTLEIEPITGGEEDEVTNMIRGMIQNYIHNQMLWLRRNQVKVSDCFMIAAALVNVHGVYSQVNAS